jgi:predicted SAM-dependent methyltransferase
LKELLNCGCGNQPLPEFLAAQFHETRLDLNPDNNPDILANMTELPEGIGPFDVIFTSHTLEHLAPREVAPCLQGFRRVLKTPGMVMIILPDLEGVEPTFDVLYESPGGPVTGFDLIYGYQQYVEAYPYMEHRCGFVRKTLEAALVAAGFTEVKVTRQECHNLLGVGCKV